MKVTELKAIMEICIIIPRDTFCAHKPGFLMPGHIRKLSYILSTSEEKLNQNRNFVQP